MKITGQDILNALRPGIKTITIDNQDDSDVLVTLEFWLNRDYELDIEGPRPRGMAQPVEDLIDGQNVKAIEGGDVSED